MGTADSTTSTAPADVTLRSALVPVIALLASTGLLYIGHGLQTTFVPLRAERAAFSSFDIGLLGSCYYFGFVAGCVFGPRMLLRAGHIRAFAAMVATGSAIALVLPMSITPAAWWACRLLLGFCMASLFIAIESWLNEKSTNATRGTVMSTYIIITFAMQTIGQLAVTVLPLGGFAPFALISILFSLSTIPLALTRSSQPAPIPRVRFRPWRLYALTPAAFGGALMIGLSNGAFWSLAPIFATHMGLSASTAARFMSVAVVAGALTQFPVGRLSDRWDRRWVLVLLTMAAAASGLVLWQMAGLGAGATLVFGFVFGAFAMPVYSVAAAHAYDWAQPEEMVETAASVVLLFGIGSIFGPIVASVLMQRLGPSALFLFTACVHATLAAFTLWRIRQRSPRAAVHKTDFDIYSTAPVGAVITPEPVEIGDPGIEVSSREVVAPANDDVASAASEDDNGDRAPDPEQADLFAPEQDSEADPEDSPRVRVAGAR